MKTVKPIHFLLLAILFAAGFFLASIIRQKQPAQAVGPGDAHPPPRDASRNPGTPGDQSGDARTQALLRDLLENRSPEIAKSDYRNLVDGFLKTAGIYGLGEKQQALFMKLVCDWYEAEPNAALRWVLGLEHSEAAVALSAIIGDVSERDLEAALALARRYGIEDERPIAMPARLIARLGECDAADFLRINRSFIRSDASFNEPDKYADGFDFRQALDALVELKAGMPASDQESNLLPEWAKRDWEAAWEYASSRKQVDANEMAGMALGVAETATTDKLADMAVYIAGIPGKPRRAAFGVDGDVVSVGNTLYEALPAPERGAFNILKAMPSPELISGFLEKLPGTRQDNLSWMLKAWFLHGRSDESRQVLEILLPQMSHAERVAAFQSESVQHLSFPGEFVNRFQRLGHSDEEIELMLPPRTDD